MVLGGFSIELLLLPNIWLVMYSLIYLFFSLIVIFLQLEGKIPLCHLYLNCCPVLGVHLALPLRVCLVLLSQLPKLALLTLDFLFCYNGKVLMFLIYQRQNVLVRVL